MLSRRFNVAIMPAPSGDLVLNSDVIVALCCLANNGTIVHFVRHGPNNASFECVSDADALHAYRTKHVTTSACTVIARLILDATAAQHPAFRARAARIQELMDLAQVRADIENVTL